MAMNPNKETGGLYQARKAIDARVRGTAKVAGASSLADVLGRRPVSVPTIKPVHV